MGQRPRWRRAGLMAVALVSLAGCADPTSGIEDPPAVEASPATISEDAEVVPAPTGEAPVPTSPPPADPATTTGTVTGVVDGDTIKVDGRSVRLIGMDTPEVGQCGYEESSAAMAALVGGQVVTLTAVAGRDDTDKYGRLLRYVEINGADAGLHEIDLGFAIARYDGRDGYGAHPRQDAYVAADAAAPDVTCAPPEPLPAAAAPVAPVPLVGTAGGTDCDQSYPTVCIPPSPPDLDCGDIADRRFTVLAPDPHRFDGNFDGVGCEGG